MALLIRLNRAKAPVKVCQLESASLSVTEIGSVVIPVGRGVAGVVNTVRVNDVPR